MAQKIRLFTCVFSCYSFLNAFVKDTTFIPADGDAAEMEIDSNNLF